MTKRILCCIAVVCLLLMPASAAAQIRVTVAPVTVQTLDALRRPGWYRATLIDQATPERLIMLNVTIVETPKSHGEPSVGEGWLETVDDRSGSRQEIIDVNGHIFPVVPKT